MDKLPWIKWALDKKFLVVMVGDDWEELKLERLEGLASRRHFEEIF